MGSRDVTSPISEVRAFEALDSRGKPTVACVVTTSGGGAGQAIVPSGASTGTHEARELRDGGERYAGQGVQRAVDNVVQVLAPAVVGLDPENQDDLDAALMAADGDARFGRLGANAALAVSIAAAVAAADELRVPLYELVAVGAEPLLPLPMVNIISGGAHAGRAIDVQDLLVVPVGATSFSEAIEWASEVRRSTAAVLAQAGHDVALVADEGGLAAHFASNRAALEALVAGMESSGLRPGPDVAIAIDVAATQLWRDGRYHLAADGRVVDAASLVAELESWCDLTPIVSIEDAVADDDSDGWRLAGALNRRVQNLGDDLFVTDEARVADGISSGIANSVLVKPNQAGCLSAARRVVELARSEGWGTVLSARSGESEDSWLADLACGWRCGQLKVGSTMRSERTAKWNRLLRIEADLGGPGVAPYAGGAAIARSD